MKNLENPQLRNVYAIVWETDDYDTTAEGTIYGISSLRPDLYTKSLESSKNTFRIDGRVGNLGIPPEEEANVHYNKSARKLQKYITSQIEKYLGEMQKL